MRERAAAYRYGCRYRIDCGEGFDTQKSEAKNFVLELIVHTIVKIEINLW